MGLKPGYKQTEIGVIPEDWEDARLGSLGPFSKGRGIRKDEALSGDIPCVRYGEIYTSHNDHVRRYISRISKQVAEGSTRLKTGDLLFAGSGETKAEIGKCVAFLDNVEAYAGGDIVILTPSRGDSAFLGYLLNAPPVVRQKASMGQGDAVVHISASALSRVRIPLPSSGEEQRAIATALSDVDALIGALDRLIAKKRDLKQAAMQQLLTGKIRLPGFSEEWGMTTMASLGQTYGGLVGKTKVDFGHGSASYIPFMNVMTDVVIDPNWLELVDVAPTESQNRVQKGDLFFNGSSETPEEVGFCAVLMDDIHNLYLNSFCFGFRFNATAQVNGLFFAYWFRSTDGRKAMSVLAQGATRYNIAKKAFLRLEIPQPSEEEQTAIAAALADMDAEIAALEARRDKTGAIKQGMMQELLTGRIRLI